MEDDTQRRVLLHLAELIPDARCELQHANAFELTIAVLLSAQCTDVMVNAVTPHLFATYPTPEHFVRAPLSDIEHAIRRIGLYRTKAKHIQQLCQRLLDQYDGNIPSSREQLMTLPGVGRKTANVILSTAFGIPAIAVDTHVERVSKRLRWVEADATVGQVEQRLMTIIPEEQWTVTHHRLVLFGRYYCKAMRPHCAECRLVAYCAEGFQRTGKGSS